MKLRAGHIVLGILAVLLWASCQQGPRRIPRDKMVDICSKMLFQDQVIRKDRTFRQQADTMLVYEGIFQQYGYNTDDYLYSLDYYLRDPDRMAKIMKEVSERMKAVAEGMTDEVTLYEWQTKMLAIYDKPVSNRLPKVPALPTRVVKDSTRDGFVLRYRQEKGLLLDTLVIRPGE